MIHISIDISVITNNQEMMLNLLFLEKLQHLLSCNLAYERVLHVGNSTRFGIMIGEGFVSKIHCHFRLSFNFCLIHSWWCSRHYLVMLTKISLKVISDTVILICMSFISLGIFSKRYNFVAIFLHLQKSCNISK